MTDRFCVLGSADEHIAKLRELADAGVDQFNIYLMNGDEEAVLEVYGREIIPAMRGGRGEPGRLTRTRFGVSRHRKTCPGQRLCALWGGSDWRAGLSRYSTTGPSAGGHSRLRALLWDIAGVSRAMQSCVPQPSRQETGIGLGIFLVTASLLIAVWGVMPVQAAGGSVNLDQWASTDKAWQNGNLNGNNSRYPEGGIVPFRLAVEGLTAGQHSININYDFTAGGHKAYDFLATWDVTNAKPARSAPARGGGISSMCPTMPASSSARVPVRRLQGRRADGQGRRDRTRPRRAA